MSSRYVSALLFGFVLLTCIPLAFGQSDDDELSVDSSIVLLNVIVKNRSGGYVSGLRQKQFTIFEDGVPQQIEYFSAEETPFAAAILLDTSGSMEERVSLARSAAITFLDGLRENDVACVYQFDSKVSLVQPFSGSNDLAAKVYDVKADGMTRLNDAVFEAASMLAKRPEKRRAIVILSDGQDNFSKYSSENALKAALIAGAVIYTVDMAPLGDAKRKLNHGALKNFSEKSGGVFIDTPGGTALREAFQNIVNELGNQYTLGYSPLNLKKDGTWRAIELKINRPALDIRTRQGYRAARK